MGDHTPSAASPATGVGIDGSLRACQTCGLVQRVPAPPAGAAAACVRCGTVFRAHKSASRAAGRAAAFSLASLCLFPAAMLLPVLEVEKLGHTRDTTIWGGVVGMISHGQFIIGLIVFVCSIIIPVAKISGMLWLSLGVLSRDPAAPPVDDLGASARRRVLAYRVIDWVGKWGMVDVLLVAVLIAAVKLGDLVTIHSGPGIVAFAGVVVFSLAATASFHPGVLWEDPAPGRPQAGVGSTS